MADPPARFWDVRVIVNLADGTQRRFMVEVDARSPMELLLPDLVKALSLEGDYEMTNRGSLDEPVLVLTAKREGWNA